MSIGRIELIFSDRWLLKLSKKSLELLRDRTLANEQKELESSRKRDGTFMIEDIKAEDLNVLISPGPPEPLRNSSGCLPMKTSGIAEKRPIKPKKLREIGWFRIIIFGTDSGTMKVTGRLSLTIIYRNQFKLRIYFPTEHNIMLSGLQTI